MLIFVRSELGISLFWGIFWFNCGVIQLFGWFRCGLLAVLSAEFYCVVLRERSVDGVVFFRPVHPQVLYEGHC